ncbi:hypothetical protein LOTGIDRAFT_127661, partial [Lottia gigantea]
PCNTNCNGGCIQNNGNCEACNDGYWGIKCQSQCPTNCRLSKCDKNNGYCSECKNYNWGDKCEELCSVNCKYHSSITCYKTSGKCNSGCKDTWYGDTCNNKCSSKCKQSKCYQDTGRCTSCKAGYYGNQCTEHKTIIHCNTGWYGNQCQTKCNSNCINGCDQTTGRCTSCNTGWYGNQCQTNCNTGWYGNQCQTKCNSNCINRCDQDTGDCLDGCIDGKSGRQCTEATGNSYNFIYFWVKSTIFY